VTIDDSAMVASGMLGAARNSSDTTQFIGCKTVSDASSSFGTCTALDSTRLFRSCTTSNANMIAAMRAIVGDSYIIFNWNSSGACTAVSVLNESDVDPKVR